MSHQFPARQQGKSWATRLWLEAMAEAGNTSRIFYAGKEGEVCGTAKQILEFLNGETGYTARTESPRESGSKTPE